MRIGRVIIIPAIVALGVAPAALSVSAVTVAAAHVSTINVHTTASSATPDVLYHG